MYKNRPITAIDFYKADHRRQYPKGTEFVYSNFTPRSDKLFNWENKCGKIVFFGLQGFIKAFMIDLWNREFFEKPKEEVVSYYKRRMDTSLGEGAVETKHIEDLHDLGYLPIKIQALEEGTLVPIGVPVLTIKNTDARFFWLVNYLESILSTMLWKPCTSATIAYEYKRMLVEYAEKTGAPADFIPFQAHDFSLRGLSGLEDAMVSGAAHLTSFCGTDSVPAIDYLEDYYGADCTKELIGASVPATEHSVMCAGGEVDELKTFKRLITELYPSGIISIVSDTWDFWKVITEYTVILKEEILARDGKTVFRPDSGDPVKIICGEGTFLHHGVMCVERECSHFPGLEIIPITDPRVSNSQVKGAVECLWDIFGGTVNDKGYKMLNEKVGLIYGDSITLQRAKRILERLEENGFASSNIVFGVGSFTYQYVTRDTFGWAMKATWCGINSVGIPIFKDPKTDSGTKKSARGLLHVNDKLELIQDVDYNQEKLGLLIPRFVDGKLLKEVTLQEIRDRIAQ